MSLAGASRVHLPTRRSNLGPWPPRARASIGERSCSVVNERLICPSGPSKVPFETEGRGRFPIAGMNPGRKAGLESLGGRGMALEEGMSARRRSWAEVGFVLLLLPLLACELGLSCLADSGAAGSGGG